VGPLQLRPFAVLPGALAPLGYRNFLLYWVGFAATNAGRWTELTGAVWLVYELTSSPVLLGLLGIARAVPTITLSPIAGVIADRVDQRRLLFFTQLLSLLASLLLGLLVVLSAVELWHVYLQVAFQAAVNAFDASVRQALFPRLVPRARLSDAVTLSVTAGRSAAFVGPALGGLAIAGLGEAAPFLLNAATFLILMGAVVAMRGVVPRTATAGSTVRRELAEGMRHLLETPILAGLLKLEIVISLFQMNAVMITIVAREILLVGPEGLGLLLAAPALGSVVGVIGILITGQARRQGRLVVVCTLAYAAALSLFAATGDFILSFAVLTLIGLLDSVLTVTRHSVLQLAAPGRMRGRVMANMRTVTAGVGPFAQTQSGLLASVVGPPLGVAVAAGAIAVAAMGTALTNHRLMAFTQMPVAERAGVGSTPVDPGDHRSA